MVQCPAAPLPSRTSAQPQSHGCLFFLQSLAPPPGLDEFQLATWRQEGGFLQQLLDNSAAEDYVLPITINGTLRRYQQVKRRRCLFVLCVVYVCHFPSNTLP